MLFGYRRVLRAAVLCVMGAVFLFPAICLAGPGDFSIDIISNKIIQAVRAELKKVFSDGSVSEGAPDQKQIGVMTTIKQQYSTLVIFGIIHEGFIPMIIDNQNPLLLKMKLAKVNGLVVSGESPFEVPLKFFVSGIKVLSLADIISGEDGPESECKTVNRNCTDTALMLLSTGQNGKLIPIKYTYDNIYANVMQVYEVLKLSDMEKDVSMLSFLNALPMTHLFGAMLPLVVEATKRQDCSRSLSSVLWASQDGQPSKEEPRSLLVPIGSRVSVDFEKPLENELELINNLNMAHADILFGDENLVNAFVNGSVKNIIDALKSKKPKMVIIGAKNIDAQAREIIKTNFDIDIIAGYSLPEAGLIALEKEPGKGLVLLPGMKVFVNNIECEYLNASYKIFPFQTHRSNKHQVLISLDEGLADEYPDSYNSKGELFVSGPNVAEGYFEDEEATKKAFVKDVKGDVWLRTGVIATWAKNGTLVIHKEKNTDVAEGEVCEEAVCLESLADSEEIFSIKNSSRKRDSTPTLRKNGGEVIKNSWELSAEENSHHNPWGTVSNAGMKSQD